MCWVSVPCCRLSKTFKNITYSLGNVKLTKRFFSHIIAAMLDTFFAAKHHHAIGVSW